MENIEDRKLKLEQRKARLLTEEMKLKYKERKMRIRNLIQLGSIIVKAKLEDFSHETLLGGLSALSKQAQENPIIKNEWYKIGKELFNQENKDKVAIILKFTENPTEEVQKLIRGYGLKWNRLRSEWYGFTFTLNELKESIKNIDHKIEILKTNSINKTA